MKFKQKVTVMKKSRLILLILVVPIIALLSYLGDVFIEDGNFRIMSEGEIFRSAQLMDSTYWDGGWERVYAKNPFKSVLNLRGANPDKDWYPPELAFAQSKGIKHYDLALSANHQPNLQTTEHLVEMMKEAPKPLLIHCKQGADRTGLASALYAYAVMGQSEEQAGKQLSILYGHFPWLTSRTGAMDRAFFKYVKAHPQPNG